MLRISALLGAIAALCLATVSPANGATILFNSVAGGTVDGHPVNARATFTTAQDAITIVVENLQADPRSVGQVITGLFFTVDSGQSSGTLQSIVGTPRWVASNGSYSDGANGATSGWVLNTVGSQLHVDLLAFPGSPTRGIIGPPNASLGTYDDAGGSIAGSGPHNPFLALSATFQLSVPGVTEQSTISGVVFGFNTSPGDYVTAAAGQVIPTSPIPEPSTLTLAGLGLAVMAGSRWRRRRQAS